MRLLVTGGAGFIGSNFVHYMLSSHDEVEIVNLDALTYAGNLDNLADLASHPRHTFVHDDICDPDIVSELVQRVDAIVNFAAETHVDRSIRADYPFIRTNVLGVQNLLAAALAAGGVRFLHVSTDEVYGQLPWRDPDDGGPGDDAPRFTEETPLAPSSPYAASKAAADLLALGYHRTHGLDVLITRSSNNYGPYQFPEKLIPRMITYALRDRELPVYGDGLNVRDWLHVRDHCRGLEAALLHGRAGEVYNLGAGEERTNLSVIRAILRELEKDEGLIQFVPDRPGHDRRYAIDPSKSASELGWRAETPFDDGLPETVAWYIRSERWWHRLERRGWESDGALPANR